eukprot:COSAG05_NODE_9723_length_606_cov_0.700197_2_plen_103_part_01
MDQDMDILPMFERNVIRLPPSPLLQARLRVPSAAARIGTARTRSQETGFLIQATPPWGMECMISMPYSARLLVGIRAHKRAKNLMLHNHFTLVALAASQGVG